MAKKISKQKIKEALIEQLRLKKADLGPFINLIDQYMYLFDISERLNKDILVRGIVYEERTATGVIQKKNNPSVKELVGVNKQMLIILEKLDISTSNIGREDDEL